jgi:trigger factor
LVCAHAPEVNMKVQVEEVSSVEKRLSFEIPGEAVSQEVESAYRTLNQSVKLKGFRPGKIPRSILERYYGKQVAEDVQNKLISDSYARALEENNIFPVGEPSVLDRQFAENKEFKYSLTVETKPEISVAGYEGLEIEREKPSVSDADVEARLAELRERSAQLKPLSASRPVQEKDFVVFDFEGSLDGQPLEGWKANDHLAEAGRKMLMGDLDLHLVGLAPGEEKTVSLALPETYARKELAGKEIRVRLKVKEIKEKILPALDDDFAKDTGDHATLADLREKLRRTLEEEQNARAEQAAKDRLLTRLIEKTPFDVPKSMVERQLQTLVSRAEWRLANQGLRLDPQNPERQKFRESLRPAAEREVRSMLILEKIADLEKISVGDEELEARLETLARELNQRPEALRSLYEKDERLEDLRARLRDEKTLESLLSRAKVSGAPQPVPGSEKK